MAISNHLRLSVRAGSAFSSISGRPQLRACLVSPALSTSHSSSPRQRSFHLATYINAGCQTAQDAVVALHSITGLSWGLTIPLVAIGVNLMFRLPFNIHTQRIIQRRSEIAPMQQGWFMRLWYDAIREKVPPENMQKEVEKRAKKQSKRIYRALGLQQWKLFSVLLGFPFWIMSLEAVRRVCGWSQGMQLPGPEAGEAPAASTADTVQSAGKGSAEVFTFSPEAATVAEVPSTANQAIDPAFFSDGFLWFTDLTAPDPYYILPTCFAGMMVLNLIPKDKAARMKLFGPFYDIFKKDRTQSPAPASLAPPKDTAADGDWRVRLIRSVVFCSPGLILATSSFPAAMHMYTITSLLTTMATKSTLSKMQQAEQQVKTCKHREMPVIRPPLAASQPDQASKKT